MKTPGISELLTPKVIRCVKVYLVAKAIAQVKREEVDKIERQILSEHCLMATLHQIPPRRISDPKDLYLCEDGRACQEFYAEASRRERAAGIKPADMPDENCPALVAESLEIEAQNLLIEASGRPFGIKPYQLYSKKRDQWIDLICCLAVNRSGFKEQSLKEFFGEAHDRKGRALRRSRVSP